MNRLELLISVSLIVLVLTSTVVWKKVQNRHFVDKPYFQEKILFDTYVFIKAYGENGPEVKRGVSRALKEMEKIDHLTNYFEKTSELSRINRDAAKERVQAPKKLLELISLAKSYGQETGGTFNVTVAPLMELWGFGAEEHVPTVQEIKTVLPLIDLEAVKVDQEEGTIWFEKEGLKLDLGGVAKGYATDRALKILKNSGVSGALVSTGSSTGVIGTKPKHRNWRIGIKHPRKKEDHLLGTVLLRDRHVSTSGDYQHFFKRQGRRFHHILDPETGFPTKGVISVTVISSKNVSETDILSTAIFVMGYPRGMKFLEKENNRQGIIVTADGKIHLSSGLKGKLKNFPEKL